MTVIIYLKQTSQAIVYRDASNSYQKGDFFCVFVPGEGKVYKYPIADIFRVDEDYSSKIKSPVPVKPVK